MSDEFELDETESRHLTRRSALKRIGAGAAVAWSAPAILSMAKASAATPVGCTNCTTGWTNAPTGCAGPGGCSDGSSGFCDTTVENSCVCDVAPFIAGSEGCTSSAACAGTYGPGAVCIHTDGLGAGTTACISQCGNTLAAATSGLSR